MNKSFLVFLVLLSVIAIGVNAHGHHSNHKASNEKISDKYKHPYAAIFFTTMSGMTAFFGGVAVVFIGKPTNFLLGHMLSFAAGVMMYISYGDLLKHAENDLGEDGFYLSNMWFFAGMGFFWLVIHFIPSPSVESIFDPDKTDNSNNDNLTKTMATPSKTSTTQTESFKKESTKHSLRNRKAKPKEEENENNNNSITSDENKNQNIEDRKNMREKLFTTGLIAALGITLHNFPEGLIVYNASVVSECDSSEMMNSISGFIHFITTCMGRGLAVTIAIGLHNIPEGIAVTLPIYAASGNKMKALTYNLFSSMTEPLGAIIFGYLFNAYLTEYIMAVLNAVVAGIMIMLCLVELIPTSLEYINGSEAVISNIFGQLIMFLSLHFLIKFGAH